MKRAPLRPHTRLRPRLATTTFVVVVACLLAAAGAAARPGMASARTVARGIADANIVSLTPDQQSAELQEISSQLGATYVRFFVSWADAAPGTVPPADNQPASAYDPTSAYMQGVASAVTQAKADGLKVIITFQDVPQWASDQDYWPQTKGVWQPYDAMSTAYLSYFGAFCQAVATQFGNQVYAYECWNEPNLYLDIFPQQTPADMYFAAHLYIKMLKNFSAGILASNSGAKRIAGATSPRGGAGRNSYETSPQRFAAVIKATKGWSSLFDYYSHHPYMPGASPRLWPEAAPGDPNTTVTLQNLGTLLKLFPTKPFLLTEYGYQTAPCLAFSGQHVSQITQASYLQRAYAFVARYKQVKLLMWYDMKDYVPPEPNPPDEGWYTGLLTASGSAKRAWYAFAGGNHLSLSAPASVKRGATLTLRGQLSCLSVGGVAGKQLVVQSHTPGRPWATLKTVYSQAAGAYTGPAGLYSVLLRPKASAYYRVSFLGVVTSRTRRVALN